MLVVTNVSLNGITATATTTNTFTFSSVNTKLTLNYIEIWKKIEQQIQSQ